MDTIACFLAVHARDLHRVRPAELRTGADDQTEFVLRLVQFVNATHLAEGAIDAVQREDRIRVGVDNQQRTRGHQRRVRSQRPLAA